jgi:hypothetical protein
MLGNLVLKFQKRRINGPFKRVAYVDPYPDRMLKAPSFLIPNLLLSLGLLILAIAFVIGLFGATLEFANARTIPTVSAIGKFVSLQVGHVAEYFQTGRLQVLVNGLSAMVWLALSLMIASKWLSNRLVVSGWTKRCTTVPAQVIDSEIQKMYLVKRIPGGSPSNQTKLVDCYVLRIKARFTHRGQTYEATPSVVNRISPGAVGVHFTTREGCEHLLAAYQKNLEIEFDPQHPLDCEIKGMMNELLGSNNWPWLPIGIFAVVLVLLSQLVTHFFQ